MDEEVGLDPNVEGPLVYGMFGDSALFLPKASADRRAAADDGPHPGTIALDDMGELLAEFGEERQGLGGDPYLWVDWYERERVVEYLRGRGYEVTRDDVLFQRMQ